MDHVLVFYGDGKIKDFPGNYTQYREWEDCREASERDNKEKKSAPEDNRSNKKVRLTSKRRLTYNEQRELETLTEEIEQMEKEKRRMEDALCSGTLPVDEMTEICKALPLLSQGLDEKTMRWMELMEIAEQ